MSHESHHNEQHKILTRGEALQQERPKYLAYFHVAFVLVSVMFFEMILVSMGDLSGAGNILAGGVFACLMLKFVTLVTWFMHLRWEKPVLSLMFLCGFILAFGTVVAVAAVMLFGHPTVGPDDVRTWQNLY